MKKLSILSVVFVLTLLSTAALAQDAVTTTLTAAELNELEELAFEPFCPNQTSTATVCIGAQMCKLGTDYKYPTYDDAGNASCPRGYALINVSSVSEACDAAEDAAGPPANCPNPRDYSDPCKTYCQGGTVTPTPNSQHPCCTVTNTRTCMQVTPVKEDGEVEPH